MGYLAEALAGHALAAGWKIRRTCFECRLSDWVDFEAPVLAEFLARKIEDVADEGGFNCPHCESRYIFLATDAHGGSYVWRDPQMDSEHPVGNVRVRYDRKLQHFPYKVEESAETKAYVDLRENPNASLKLPEIAFYAQMSRKYGGSNRLRAIVADINSSIDLRSTGCAWMFHDHPEDGLVSCGGYVGMCRTDWSLNTYDGVMGLAFRLQRLVHEKVASGNHLIFEVQPVEHDLRVDFKLSIEVFCFSHSRKRAFLQGEKMLELVRRAIIRLATE